VVTVLFNAGAQVPLIPFVDVVGSGARTPPAQIAATGLKVGAVLLLIPMVIVTILAHCPASGVNV
jgi:hypothetical protein